MVKWKRFQTDVCPGCGRLLSQHEYNETLERAETSDDYTPWTIECPAAQATAQGQEMWRKEHKQDIEAFHNGKAADPAAGVHWLAQAPGETLPVPTD